MFTCFLYIIINCYWKWILENYIMDFIYKFRPYISIILIVQLTTLQIKRHKCAKNACGCSNMINGIVLIISLRHTCNGRDMWLYNVKMISTSPKWFYTDIVEVSNNWQLSRWDIIDLHFCGFGDCRSVRIKRQVRLTQ